MKLALLAFTSLALLVTPLVKGEDQLFHNGIEETRGISAPHGDFASALKFNKYGTRLLVGVKWHGFHEDAEPNTGWRLFWVESKMKINPNPDGSKRLTAYDIAASLVTRVVEEPTMMEEDDITATGFLKMGQAQWTRDVDTDHGRFTLKAFEVGGVIATDDQFSDVHLIATVSLDALGYSLVKRYKNPVAQQGLHVIGLNATFGIGFKLPKKLSLQLAFSGAADFATNGLSANGYGEAAFMKRSKKARGSFFVRAGGESESFPESGLVDPDPSTRDNEADVASAGFVMTGLNFSW